MSLFFRIRGLPAASTRSVQPRPFSNDWTLARTSKLGFFDDIRETGAIWSEASHFSSRTFVRGFGSSWANYDKATPGTFRLVPPPVRIPALKRDYEAMRDMYLSEPPNFDEILAVLAELEAKVNG